MNKYFFLVCGRNCSKYIERCLSSIKKQTYQNYEVLITDDCSVDDTSDIVTAFLDSNKEFGKKCRFTKNETRKYILENQVTSINLKTIKEDDILIILDGDDCLTDENSLSVINQAYQNPMILATYGNYKHESNGKVRVNQAVAGEFSRKNPRLYISHIRTFKKSVFNKIDDADLRDTDGNYFKVTADLAISFPIIELCGKERVGYIDDPILIYNDMNPEGDGVINLREQLRVDHYLRSKPIYSKL